MKANPASAGGTTQHENLTTWSFGELPELLEIQQGKQTLIGIQDYHQCNFGKVMPFREHLSTDQDARFAAMDSVEHRLNGTAARGAVPIQARQGRVGKEARQGFLDAFGSLSDRQQRLPAIAANGGYRRLRTAVMAAKLPRAAMQSHARIAVRAGSDPAAGIAEQGRRIAAPVQKHDDLTARP